MAADERVDVIDGENLIGGDSALRGGAGGGTKGCKLQTALAPSLQGFPHTCCKWLSRSNCKGQTA